MAEFFNMPKLGMDMEEGTVVRWLKKEGDAVAKGEPFVEIETDKSSVEAEASLSGFVLRLYYAEGDTIPINKPIASIGAKDENAPELTAAAPAAPAAPPASAPPAPAQRAPFDVLQGAAGAKVRISPRARKLAKLHDVDVARLSPSSPSGRIMERDVRQFIESGAAPVQKAPARTRFDQIIPLTGIRKITAARMHQSLSEMAQANHRMDADMTAMSALRAQLNADPRFGGVKFSFVDLMVLACAKALLSCPNANASLQPDGLHLKNCVNVGVAVATDRGLVVPVIRDADLMTLWEISEKSRLLIDKARTGSLSPDEMTGGTFTLTNLGMYGIDSFTAIVNPPETCILAIGRIAERVIAENGHIAIRPMMNLSLSYDHRVLDGAPAAEFLRQIKRNVENPAMMFIEKPLS